LSKQCTLFPSVNFTHFAIILQLPIGNGLRSITQYHVKSGYVKSKISKIVILAQLYCLFRESCLNGYHNRLPIQIIDKNLSKNCNGWEFNKLNLIEYLKYCE
jgi:hypothetical protein